MSSSPTRPTPEAEIARVRRAPRWGVFLGIGVGLGVVVAFLLTAFGNFGASPATQVSYPFGQVFGFLLLWTVPAGIAVFGVIALLLERAARRSERVVRVDHRTIAE